MLWTLVTCSLLDLSLPQVRPRWRTCRTHCHLIDRQIIISFFLLAGVGQHLETLWGSKEYGRFVLAVCLCSTLGVLVISIISYAVAFSTTDLYAFMAWLDLLVFVVLTAPLATGARSTER